MPQSHQNRRRRARSSENATLQPSLKRQLLIVFAAAFATGGFAVLLGVWEQLSVPPERLVNIYRKHGCRCAFELADSLKAEGFVVRLHEYETLEYVRGSLHTPANLRGCHVGEYLGYFLEGHVASAALIKLAQQQPVALGIVTETNLDHDNGHVTIAREERSRVVLVEADGRTRMWIEPNGAPHG